MDDLLGEDWQATAKPSASSASPSLKPNSFASNYNGFRNSPTLPLSGTTSPQNISRPPSSVNGAAKAPGSDSFGSLLTLKSQKQTSNVSIQERQRQIAEDKRRQQEENSRLWDNLGSGRGTPEIRVPSPAGNFQKAEEDGDDILAAFNKAAPVDKASHFPPPSSEPLSRKSTPAASAPTQPYNTNDDDDDDPFGLGSMPQKQSGNLPARRLQQEDYDDDDILGDLGRPLTERKSAPSPPVPANRKEVDAPSEPDDYPSDDVPQDRAVAELIDMGFPADNARIALAENGGDVQRAVGWLLQQAHEESRAKSRGEAINRQRSPNGEASPPRRRREDEAVPSWMRQESRASSAPRRQDSRSPAGGDRDASQVAQDFGSKLFKGANSLWKASQKQMAKTVSEFQQDREPNQPRWMQDSGRTSDRSQSQRRVEAKVDIDVTDEAAMLDMPRERPVKASRQKPSSQIPEQAPAERRTVEPLPNRPSAQPRFMQQPPAAQDKRPASKLSRQDVEDQAAQAYVSPARRKRPTPKPEPTPEPEVDLFSPAPSRPPPASTNGASSKAPTPVPTPRAPTAPPKPKAPPRSIPSVTQSALSSSAAHRKKGGEAFKRGDYASAHDSYTAALSPLPSTHPILIIVLSNRALTALKTGDAKTAVSDADQALAIIGASQGVGESIDLGGAEGAKDMREFYGKALTRKAEALEHLEKWRDAAAVWRQAIEAGVGGAVSIRGRDRCEKAAAPKPAAAKPAPARSPAPGAARAPPAKGLGNSTQRPTISSAVSAEAVKKLRAANAAAEKADDEKFQLADQVDAKLTAWKGGKADNLRALLQSLDAVLWADAGWKKVGMSDLVMPNKVKIVYMKAIAKVHPDKISQDATTEQRMVSAAVFSTLNEAWDKFKKDNNL